MTKFIIYNDCHIGSDYCDDQSLLAQILSEPASDYTIYNGDVIDLACCPKDKVAKYETILNAIERSNIDNFTTGNHERCGSRNLYLIKTTPDGKKVLFTHGDVFMDWKKWEKYRSKPKGAGFLKRKLVSILDDMDWIKGNRPVPESFYEKAYEKAKRHNCNYVICGHLHPLKTQSKIKGDITIMVLPKGRNEVWI